MEKEGAEHIEVIISYILFIGFLLFIFYFFNPLNSSKLLDSSLPSIMQQVGSSISTDLKTYSISILNVEGNDAVSVDLGEDLTGKGVRVESYSDGSILPSAIDNTKVIFKPMGEKFVLVKVSDGFSSIDNLGATGTIYDSSGYFTKSYAGTRSVFSEMKADALAEKYKTNYEGLRSDFSLSRNDFTFDITFTNASGRMDVNGTRFIPNGLEVYSDSKREEILLSNGQTSFADMDVKIW